MDIIKKPIITEKMTELGETLNRYAFVVDRRANKIEIRAAIEAAYDVTVEKVNTMIQAGKAKSRFTKAGVVKGNTGHFKKAIVTLKDGDEIDFYSNI
jgi:large subunit ribosomal protein L23